MHKATKFSQVGKDDGAESNMFISSSSRKVYASTPILLCADIAHSFLYKI